MINYAEKIYRPWMEADAIILQVTKGCTHNMCLFCNMFKEKQFTIRDIEDIFRDIKEMRRGYRNVESIFLTDGNVLALKTDLLLKILCKIKETFPECKRVSLYAGLDDIRRKSASNLKKIRDAGVVIAYVGLESGDRVTLERMLKRLTPKQALEGMEKAREAGIEILASIILGLGGKERSKEHIIETTNLINLMKPDQLGPMVLTIQPGTILEQHVKNGLFNQATPLQILKEEKYLLENMEDFDTFYWADHMNNIVTLKGKLPDSKEIFLEKINRAIESSPVAKQEVLHTSAW